MVDVKEIKSVKLTTFTKMSASIYGILGFIAAIFMLIVLSIIQATGVTAQFAPQLAHFNWITGLGIPLLVLLPIAAFFITMAVSFFSVLAYNVLVPRLGGIKLEMDGKEIVKIPEISFAIILAAIQAIWAFIAGLVLAAAFSPMFSFISTLPEAASIKANITANITNTSGAALPAGAFGALGVIVPLVLIIALPILAFVLGFIWNALFAIFYNYLVSRVSKIQLEFAAISGTLHELKHIPVIPTALAVALTFALLGIISGIFSGNFGQFISNFVLYFIETALIALLYNYLAPKIGTIKLNMQ